MKELTGLPQVEWYQDIVDGERWDDLRSPATAINPPGVVSDPDFETTSGLPLFDSSRTEILFILQQLPHSWKEGSAISPHIHWQKTTSDSGNVLWRMRYKHAPVNDVMDADWSDPVDVLTTVAGTEDTDTAGKHLITSFGTIDMAGRKISHIILYELSRIGGGLADTYGADARLLEFDTHYQIDSFGSETVFVKQITKGTIGI